LQAPYISPIDLVDAEIARRQAQFPGRVVAPADGRDPFWVEEE